MTSSVRTNIVTFLPSDWEHKKLEGLAEDISAHVWAGRGRIIDLNNFLKKSGKWQLGKHQDHLQKWKSVYLGRNPKKAAHDKIIFTRLIESIFITCSSQDDWLKMRGLIPEKLYERHFSSIHKGKAMGFGKKVNINGKDVIYQPTIITEDDRKRQSIDAGAWDGTFGEFVEIKFQPTAFRIKDIGYLNLLERKLDEEDIRHIIKLLTFDEVKTTKNLLIAENLLSEDTRFDIISHESFMTI